jgi:ferredoxin
VATKGGGRINEHFGHAKEFQVYELSTAGAKFVGHRRVDNYCQGGFGEEDSLETVIPRHQRLPRGICGEDRRLPERRTLLKAGIDPVDQYAHEFIESRRSRGSRTISTKSSSGEISTGSAAMPTFARARSSLPTQVIGVTTHGIENHRLAVHGLLGVRAGMSRTSRSRRKNGTFVINPKKCTECIGHFDAPQCVAVCPVDNTCVIDNSLPALPAVRLRNKTMDL